MGLSCWSRADHDAGVLGGFDAAQEDFVGLSLHSLNTGPSPPLLSVMVLVVSFSAFCDLDCAGRSPRHCAGQAHSAGRVPNETESLPNTSVDVTFWLSIDDHSASILLGRAASAFASPSAKVMTWRSVGVCAGVRCNCVHLRRASHSQQSRGVSDKLHFVICLICLFNLAGRTHLLSSQQPEDS